MAGEIRDNDLAYIKKLTNQVKNISRVDKTDEMEQNFQEVYKNLDLIVKEFSKQPDKKAKTRANKLAKLQAQIESIHKELSYY